jgi:sodium transport system permease protein
MRWDFVRFVAWKELLSTFRDKRTLASTILLPLVMIPIFLIGFPLIISQTIGGEQEKRQVVGVVGLERMPASLKKSLEGDANLAVGVELKAVTDATKAVQDGTVEAAIVVPEKVPSSAGGKHFKQSSQKAQLVFSKISDSIDAYARELTKAKLLEAGLSDQVLTPVVSSPINADTVAEKASGVLAFIIPMFLIQWMLAGGQATAIDATAGEKERGTLEALLVTPVSRLEVLIGKLIAVVTFSVSATIFSMLGLVLTGVISAFVLPLMLKTKTNNGANFTELLGGNLSLSGEAFIMLLLVGITMAILIASLLIAICIFARSFKEAQTYIAPLSIVLIIPAIFLQFADFLARGSQIYAIPVIGSMLTILDVVKGLLVWPHALTAIGVNLLFAAVMVVFALSSFRREQVLFRN